jgi:sphingosine kinase
MTFDLCSVTYDDHRYFSFLSQNYGITAYADLGTEHMR